MQRDHDDPIELELAIDYGPWVADVRGKEQVQFHS
jgi:hypothetical protein